MRRRLVAILGLALLLLGSVAPATMHGETRRPSTADPIYLVMDVSGSMAGERLLAAKMAARDFIQRLQPGQVFALYTFPGGKKQVQGCSAGSFVIAPSVVNTTLSGSMVNILAAQGNTPTVPALHEIMRSADELGLSRAQVVLVTDGEANCGDSNDVCTVAPLLKQRGLDLRIHTVSLNNTPTGDASLACLARETGGTSTTVTDTESLIEAIRQASSYVADLDVDVPEELFNVTGSSAILASRLRIAVTASGTTRIPDARLVVTFTSGTGERHVRVSDPVITAANLDPGVTRTYSTMLYPYATADGPITWTVSLIAGSIPVAKQTGIVQVRAPGSVADAGDLLADATNVVIVGDSYSSGEGAGDYVDGSPRVDKCHRSPNAWGRVLFPSAEILACSGAVVADFTHHNPLTIEGVVIDTVEPQLAALLRTTSDGTPPDLVMMTLGGNDVGFGEVVSKSVSTGAPFSLATMYDQSVGFPGLQAELETTYARINNVVNSKEAVTARQGKIAQIVVLSYVLGVPQAGGSGCFLGFSSEELYDMWGFGLGLNNVVRNAVRNAAAAGVPVHFVPTVEDAFQPDHTVCDKEPWLRTDTGAALAGNTQELMHPTVAGQRAVANSVLEWSRTASALPLGAAPGDYRDVPIVVDTWLPWDKTTTLGALALPFSMPTLVPEPGSNIAPSISCSGTCEWGEGVITVTVQSVPIPLGVLRVGAGSPVPEGALSLPADLAPGHHELVYRGTDVNGQPKEHRASLTVWRAGSNRGLWLAGTGLVILAVAGVLALASHVSRPSS